MATPGQQAKEAAPKEKASGGGGRKEAGEERHADIFTKTKMCKFHLLRLCSKGEACHFAHTREDLNPLPDLYRTKLCKALINTGHCGDASCKYAHNREELRAPGIPAPRMSARGPKGEKAPRGKAKGAAKPARGAASDRGGGAGQRAEALQGDEHPSVDPAQRDHVHMNSKEGMIGMPVMPYPGNMMLGFPGHMGGMGTMGGMGNRTFQVVMQPQMGSPQHGGMSPYGVMVPPDKAAQMAWCYYPRPPDMDTSTSTTGRSFPVSSPQEPSRSSSQSGSDGSCLEPSEQSSSAAPGDASPTLMVSQGKSSGVPDLPYSNGVHIQTVTVKNTFIDFEPVKQGSGLRTVHTAGGRLDLLSEELETVELEEY